MYQMGDSKLEVRELLVKAFASAWEAGDKTVDRDTYINSSINVIDSLQVGPEMIYGEEGQGLLEGELDHLPLRDQEADFACINLVLHHLSDPGEGLREIRRSLTTGGHLFVADFLQHHDETMRSRYGDRWLGFDEERLQERLRQAGFEVLSCTRQAVGRGLFLLLVQARAC